MIEVRGIPAPAAAARAAAAAQWRRDGLHGGLTIAEAVTRRATRASPGRLILHSERRPVALSAADYAAAVGRVAGALAGLGAHRGDVVALQLPGCYEGYLAMVATMAAGGVTLPLHPAHGSRELKFILAQTSPRILIVPEVWRGRPYPETLEQLGEVAPARVVVVGEPQRPGDTAWRDLENSDRTLPSSTGARSADPCAVLYTSGTSAEPKGVAHTHDSILAVLSIEGARPSPAMRSPGLGHIGGVLLGLGPLVSGAALVSMERWTAETAAQLAASYKVRTLSGPPIFFRSLMEQARALDHDLGSLEEVLFGGAAIAPAEVENAGRHGVRACRSYGSTEHPLACRSAIDDPLEVRAGTDGVASPGGQIAILGDDGGRLPAGKVGEIALMGPAQFAGYLDPALNAAQFHPDGWYLTGDLGVLDDQGRLRVQGRKKDIIIRGGENISAREVEDLLAAMPGVEEAAAVAMPDERLGERVCAFIRTAGGAGPTLDDVRRHFIEAGAAKFKIPERLVRVEDFPRTFTGKIQKYILRARLEEEFG